MKHGEGKCLCVGGGGEGVSKIKNYRPGNNLCLKDKQTACLLAITLPLSQLPFIQGLCYQQLPLVASTHHRTKKCSPQTELDSKLESLPFH